MKKYEVAVAGGGISGLAVAFELIERGLAPEDLILLESGTRPGGNIRTDRSGGLTVEWGPNGFLDNSPPTLDLVRRLGMEDRLLSSRESAAIRFIYRNGKLHEVPVNPIAMIRSGLLTLGGKLRIFREPFVPKGGGGGESVFDFAARRIGGEAARVLVDSMVSGVFAGDARRLELEAAFPKMAELEAKHGGLVKALIAIKRERRKNPAPKGSGGPAGPSGRLTSFKNGMEELIDGLAGRLGDSLRTKMPVASIERSGGGFRIAFETGEPIEASKVVLATPSSVAARIVRAVDGELSGLLREIPSAPVAVVATAYDVKDLDSAPWGFGFLVPRGEGPRILGCLWTSSIWEGRAPEGTVLLRSMIGGAHEPEAAALPDGELLAVVARDLEATMGLRAKPAEARIYRHPLGIPQYEPGHTARLAKIDECLARVPGLFLSGNSYGGISVNHCAAEAPEIAEKIYTR